MKTKFKLQTQTFAVPTRTFNVDTASHQAQAMEIPGLTIEGEIECTVQELKELWSLQKEVLADAPKVLENLGLQLIDVVETLDDKMHPGEETTVRDDSDVEEANDIPDEEVELVPEQ